MCKSQKGASVLIHSTRTRTNLGWATLIRGVWGVFATWAKITPITLLVVGHYGEGMDQIGQKEAST